MKRIILSAICVLLFACSTTKIAETARIYLEPVINLPAPTEANLGHPWVTAWWSCRGVRDVGLTVDEANAISAEISQGIVGKETTFVGEIVEVWDDGEFATEFRLPTSVDFILVRNVSKYDAMLLHKGDVLLIKGTYEEIICATDVGAIGFKAKEIRFINFYED